MTKLATINCTHLNAANKALDCFAPGTSIVVKRRVGVCVEWTQHSGKQFSRRWQTQRGQDFYPTWYRHWGHGGTATTALAQLVRWMQGKPILPLATWRHWTGERVYLGQKRGPECVSILEAAGYPETVNCVLCGVELRGLDWWSLDGVSGPCCSWTAGCRQDAQ